MLYQAPQHIRETFCSYILGSRAQLASEWGAGLDAQARKLRRNHPSVPPAVSNAAHSRRCIHHHQLAVAGARRLELAGLARAEIWLVVEHVRAVVDVDVGLQAVLRRHRHQPVGFARLTALLQHRQVAQQAGVVDAVYRHAAGQGNLMQ